MDSENKTSLLLELNLQLLTTNLRLNSLFLKSSKNSEAILEGQQILNELENWVVYLQQYYTLDPDIKSILDRVANSVRQADQLELPTKQSPITPLKSESTLSETANSSSPEKFETSVVDHDLSQDLVASSVEGEHFNADQIEPSVSSPSEITTDPNNATQIESPSEKIEEKSLFNRSVNINDRWDYINNIETFMQGYERFVHLLLPNFILSIIKELHRYETSDQQLQHISVQYPMNQLYIILTKLLREAPGASLLRRIRRIRRQTGTDLTKDSTLNIMELQLVTKLVHRYFSTLEKYFDPSTATPPSVDTLLTKTKSNVNQFSLGPLTVETRIMNVMRRTTEEAFDKFYSVLTDGNEQISKKDKIIQLAGIQLLTELGSSVLSERRLLQLLEDLKA